MVDSFAALHRPRYSFPIAKVALNPLDRQPVQGCLVSAGANQYTDIGPVLE
jgi:hypothetical protein